MDQKAINTIRFLGVDAVNKANSGHPGIVLGAAPMAYKLFTAHMNIDVKKPQWINRDRFVLSAGHGSMLLYAINHLSGYKVSIEDIKKIKSLNNSNIEGVIVGKSIYDGDIKINELAKQM